MSEWFKSKVGVLLAGIYVIPVVFCVMYYVLIERSISVPFLLLMILIAPWFYFLSTVPVQLGIGYLRPSHAPTR